eukprot:TRINITY_DN1560_c0_g1_i1.p1 TRINITY_DN1560_c0_g1~~TRINITY_DN1560_c0_g1_i1.p1  ORF type:complete len:480 (-),score=69.72 TRINITY_DN1560_c0_g1_i1:40-1479(-)
MAKGRVFLFLFPSSQRYKVDSVLTYLFGHGGCPELSSVTDVNISHPRIYTAEYPYESFSGNITNIASLDRKYLIKESSEWYLYLFNCQSLSRPNSRGITINGVVEWINPFGHLSAEKAPLLPFSFFMMILWVVVSITWAILALRFRTDLLCLQKLVCFLLLIALTESICYFLELLKLNIYGEIDYFLPFFRVIIGVTKNVFGQTLVFLLSIGFGIVCARISMVSKVCMILGCFGIFGCSMIYAIFQVLEADFYIVLLTTLTLEVMQLPMLFFFVLSIGWALICIHMSMSKLRNHKEMEKVEKFHAMAAVIVICAILGSVVMGLHGIATLFTSVDRWWSIWWLWDAYWQLQFLVATVLFLYIWRPKQNNIEYHISDGLREEEEQAYLPPPTEREDEEQQRELRNRLRESILNRQPVTHTHNLSSSKSESESEEVALTKKRARIDESSGELENLEDDNSSDAALAIALREISFEDSESSDL